MCSLAGSKLFMDINIQKIYIEKIFIYRPWKSHGHAETTFCNRWDLLQGFSQTGSCSSPYSAGLTRAQFSLFKLDFIFKMRKDEREKQSCIQGYVPYRAKRTRSTNPTVQFNSTLSSLQPFIHLDSRGFQRFLQGYIWIARSLKVKQPRFSVLHRTGTKPRWCPHLVSLFLLLSQTTTTQRSFLGCNEIMDSLVKDRDMVLAVITEGGIFNGDSTSAWSLTAQGYG